MRVEHNLANAPVMLYAGLGHTERFPDYWELFSPKFGPAGSTSAFEGVKAKTTQIDIGGQYSGEQFRGGSPLILAGLMILSCLNMIQNLRISQADNINATIMGGEMGMEYALTPYWKADASLAYAWGKYP